jgi:hypothetical protein
MTSEELKPVNCIHVSQVATLHFRILNVQVTYHQVGLTKRVCPATHQYAQYISNNACDILSLSYSIHQYNLTVHLNMRQMAAQSVAHKKKLSMYKVLQYDAKKELKLPCDFMFQKMKISYEG